MAEESNLDDLVPFIGQWWPTDSLQKRPESSHLQWHSRAAPRSQPHSTLTHPRIVPVASPGEFPGTRTGNFWDEGEIFLADGKWSPSTWPALVGGCSSKFLERGLCWGGRPTRGPGGWGATAGAWPQCLGVGREHTRSHRNASCGSVGWALAGGPSWGHEPDGRELPSLSIWFHLVASDIPTAPESLGKPRTGRLLPFFSSVAQVVSGSL